MKQHPRSLPWLVELWVKDKWWLLDQFGTEARAAARVQDLMGRGNYTPDELRIRFDPTPEEQTSIRK